MAVVPLPMQLSSFNPRTHSGCDFRTMACSRSGLVSIHAPTRDATCLLNSIILFFLVSIHAPTRDATLSGKSVGEGYLWFQSTHPLGMRRAHAQWSAHSFSVSIHAPTRDATSLVICLPFISEFQSTHPLGMRLHIQ